MRLENSSPALQAATRAYFIKRVDGESRANDNNLQSFARAVLEGIERVANHSLIGPPETLQHSVRIIKHTTTDFQVQPFLDTCVEASMDARFEEVQRTPVFASRWANVPKKKGDGERFKPLR